MNFGLLVLRVGLGALMVTHGVQKCKIILSGGAGQWLDPIGLGGATSLYLATFAELVCATLVILGLFTRSASLILAFTMFVAAFVFLKSAPWGDKELAVVFFVGFTSLFFLGGGEHSFSHVLFGDSGLLRHF